MLFHIFSPFCYILFVKLLHIIPVCSNSNLMKLFRQIHNIILSILSFIMLFGITYGTYSVGKLNSFNELL